MKVWWLEKFWGLGSFWNRFNQLKGNKLPVAKLKADKGLARLCRKMCFWCQNVCLSTATSTELPSAKFLYCGYGNRCWLGGKPWKCVCLTHTHTHTHTCHVDPLAINARSALLVVHGPQTSPHQFPLCYHKHNILSLVRSLVHPKKRDCYTGNELNVERERRRREKRTN